MDKGEGDKIRRYLGVALVALISIGVAWLLFRKIANYDLAKVRASLTEIPLSHLLMAFGFTLLNYLVLIGYDWLAVRGIGHPLPVRRIAMASFIGYAISNTLGTLVGGTAVRFRLYSSWGLSVIEVMRLIALLGLIFWLGVFVLAGVTFVVQPLEIPDIVNLRQKLPFTTVQPLGYILLSLVAVYLVTCAFWRKPLRFMGRELRLPSLGNSVCQLAVASGDMAVASLVLYSLLPASCQMPFPEFLSIYLFAWVSVVVLHVPGGVGVFELVFTTLLAAESEEAILGTILVWRMIYFVLPVLIAAPLMGSYELRRNWRGNRDSVAPVKAEKEKQSTK